MREYFKAASKLLADQVRGIADALRHPGMKGAAGEEVVRTFLRKYLPSRYRIAQGKVVDHQGNESKQIDVIVIDASTTIPLYIDEVNIVVPIESVYAVLEVKTGLNRKTMAEALNNMATLHRLVLPQDHSFVRGGVLINPQPRDMYPRGYILALSPKRSVSIKTLGEQYYAFVLEQGIHFPLVSCCGILGAGYFVDLPREHGDGADLCVQRDAGEDTLLLFFLSMVETMAAMGARPQPSFDLYLNLFGKVTGSLYVKPPNPRMQRTRPERA